jgi:hypothetical protein
MSGSTVLRRSEPGATLTFAPSGTKTGAVITKPASIGESETHWEIEASTDNANFYRLAQTVVGTTTYTDTVALGTGYATSGTLSADTGDYTRIPSGKFLVSDDDRLVIAGSWENADYASRIWWTPVYGDTTGVGNDERLEMDTDPFLDLDGFKVENSLPSPSQSTVTSSHSSGATSTRLSGKGQRPKPTKHSP